MMNDERMKELFNGSEDIVSLFSKINAYEFKYTPKALSIYEGTKGVDEGTNVGVMAQELESNPLTANTITEDEHGYKEIEVGKLVAVDTAVLADICRRLLVIETKLGVENNGEEK